jgi:hypothetical protein
MNYTDYIMLSSQLDGMTSEDNMETYLKSINADYTLVKIDSDTVGAKFIPIENTIYSWIATISWDTKNTVYITDPLFENTLLWVFPNFIKEFSADEWQQRLSYFTESQLSIQLAATSRYGDADELTELILQYAAWYNANTYNAETETFDTTTITSSAGNIIALLKQLKPTPTNA